MLNFNRVMSFLAALAILVLVHGTATADVNPDHPYLSKDLTVTNADFSTAGSGGADWNSPAGEQLENNTVLSGWSFASEHGTIFTGSRYTPTTSDYPGGAPSGQVARFTMTYGSNKWATYLVSDPIPGETIEATVYTFTVQVGQPNKAGHPDDNAYKYGFGFLCGDTSDYDSAADNFHSNGGAYWVAPWEINTGNNNPAYLDRPADGTWVTYSWTWDNTGTGTPAVVPDPFKPNEGYTPGVGVFTDQRNLGEQLRIALKATFRTYEASLDFDDITLVKGPDVLALEGDANIDRIVDGQDFTILKANYGQSPKDWIHGDFNHDDVVDGQDFTWLKFNFGKSLAPAPAGGGVPEPATTALLAVGALGLLVRRRR